MDDDTTPIDPVGSTAQQPAVAAAPAAVPARQPRTGVVVAATLGGVLLVGLVFLAGFLTGRATGGDDVASAPAATEPAPAGTAAPPAASDGSIDECLVGTWRTTEHTESADTEQGRVTISDVQRTLEITADGTETITYDGTPATVSTETGQGAGTGQAIFEGTVVYAVSTADGQMSFSLTSVDGTLTIRAEGGEPQQQELQPGVAPVSYTCSDDQFVQETTGYRSVMERVD